MANENLRIDENTRWVLGGITNDVNEEIRNARVNPATGRLIVEAVIASTNTSIGGTIPGGTPGSVLFIGPGSTLDQDNPNFFYDYTNFFLGLGTNTPDATLNVNGSVHFDLGGDATGDIFYRDAGGFLAPLGIGTAGQVLTVSGGLPSWQNGGTGSAGYDTIQDNGTPLTQRSTMNFVNYFDITDVSSVTTININTTQLGGDQFLGTALSTNTYLINGLLSNNTFMTGIANNSTFLSALLLNSTFISGIVNIVNTSGSISIDLSTQVTGLLSPTNIDVVALANDATFISNLEPNLLLQNLGGLLNVGSQITGVVPLANGGTGQSLTDPGYDAAYVWDNTLNQTRLANLSGLTYNSGTNTLAASGGGIISPATSYQVFEDFITTVSSTEGPLINNVKVGSTGLYFSNGASVGNQFLQNQANHPGILRGIASGTTVELRLYSDATLGKWNDLLPNSTFETVVNFGALAGTQTGSLFFGFIDNLGVTSSVHYLGFFITSPGPTNVTFQGKYFDNSGGPVTTSTSTVTYNAWHKLTIVVDGTATNASFYVDGTLLGTIAISSLSVDVFPKMQGSNAGSKHFDIDYWNLTSGTITR